MKLIIIECLKLHATPTSVDDYLHTHNVLCILSGTIQALFRRSLSSEQEGDSYHIDRGTALSDSVVQVTKWRIGDLSYLSYHFRPFICVICELSFDSELKRLNHILRKQHTEKNDRNFVIKTYELSDKIIT